jgi:uncharacterized protein (DUF169 family)
MGIMDKNVVNEAVKNMNLALKLDRKIVGVKFLFDEDEFKKADVKKLTGKMAYCVMIRTAMTGKAMKAAADNFGCMGAARALSVVEPDEMSLSGRYYQRLGLYQDLATSKNVQRNMTFCRHKAYGIMVKPVEEYDEEPDVVLIVTNPYNGMRIIQAYTHVFGFNTAYKMSGNQAICSECTAFPFESNNINVSLLCAGTRFKAKWGDEEMAIGFPFNQFLSIVRGLYATLDLIEPNEKKAEIEVRFGETGRTPPTIHYNKNYYTGLNPE